MSVNELEYRKKLRSYSRSTMEKMSAMIDDATLEMSKKILHSVAESKTEEELLKKLDKLQGQL